MIYGLVVHLFDMELIAWNITKSCESVVLIWWLWTVNIYCGKSTHSLLTIHTQCAPKNVMRFSCVSSCLGYHRFHQWPSDYFNTAHKHNLEYIKNDVWTRVANCFSFRAFLGVFCPELRSNEQHKRQNNTRVDAVPTSPRASRCQEPW